MLARISLFSACFCFLSVAGAQLLSEPRLFNRCYTQLTGRAVPLNHPVMAKVKAGTITAQKACEDILDKTELAAGSGMLTQSDPEAALVLNNFYTFHRTWFPANNVEQILGNNAESGLGTKDIYDATEPGLALTRAMFVQSGKYSDVLTSSTGVRAIREDDPSIMARIGFTISDYVNRSVYYNNAAYALNNFVFSHTDPAKRYTGNTATAIVQAMPRIETGELVGIRSNTEVAMVPNVAMAYLDPGGEIKGNSVPGLNYTFNFNSILGGGVLGTPIYLLLNFGHPLGLKMDGATKLPRRWSQTNMTSFLCATLPALRESDVVKFVVGGSDPAVAPFRKASSCIMCHANLDPMASTARNAVVVNSDYYMPSDPADPFLGKVKNSYLLTTFRPELSPVAGWPAVPTPDFHRQTPTGKLFFRSVTGALIDKPVTGIASLGAEMAATDDYYQCAAKRYFEYFTGIQVALYDRQDPRYATLNRQLSAEAIADRQYIEKIAANLRQSQSIKQMIKSIMTSDYYRSVKFRP